MLWLSVSFYFEAVHEHIPAGLLAVDVEILWWKLILVMLIGENVRLSMVQTSPECSSMDFGRRLEGRRERCC